MGFLGTSFFYMTLMLRRWLALRLFPRKTHFYLEDDRVIAAPGLSVVEHTVVLALVLVIVSASVAAISLSFLGFVNLVYD